ncbi:hypothetical protein POM88_015822 [Heracleum sosnowskyi]|uniref:Uncharacterized protein n=1 Tax=Heracleum sosnowskyi TaxID=360622 RepID=A0AAD8IMC6_9APIA|nr:hypothetical protein POM88_015822 [Heracleum sosnowskyi]
MLSGWKTAGHLACPHCAHDHDAYNLSHGGKTTWFDNHRKFLPANHPFQKNKNWFTKGKTVTESAPPVRTGEDVEFADGSCLQGLVFCCDGSQSGVRTIPCDSMESSSIMNFTASLNADTREALAACHGQKWNPQYSRYLSPLVYKVNTRSRPYVYKAKGSLSPFFGVFRTHATRTGHLSLDSLR